MADDDPLTPFPIEKHCFPEPILPPADWTYPGTILMSGYAGIHAMQANWETPRIVSFFRWNANGDYPILGGRLSPDGNWYAMPMGEMFTEITYTTYWFTQALRIYSTAGDEQVIDIDLSDYSEITSFSVGAYTIFPIEWSLDSQSLIVGGLLIKPFEDTATAIGEVFSAPVHDGFQISPDFTRLYGEMWMDELSRKGLYDLTESPRFMLSLNSVDSVSWRRDSSGFIAYIKREDPFTRQLVLYDRDGNVAEQVFDLNGTVEFRRSDIQRNEAHWSPDDSRFVFVRDGIYSEPDTLYMIDWDERIVIDTCLDIALEPIWSPDGTMLAYLIPAKENLKMIIVDLESWTAYDVARHSGVLRSGDLYWRPTIMAWREAVNS